MDAGRTIPPFVAILKSRPCMHASILNIPSHGARNHIKPVPSKAVYYAVYYAGVAGLLQAEIQS